MSGIRNLFELRGILHQAGGADISPADRMKEMARLSAEPTRRLGAAAKAVGGLANDYHQWHMDQGRQNRATAAHLARTPIDRNIVNQRMEALKRKKAAEASRRPSAHQRANPPPPFDIPAPEPKGGVAVQMRDPLRGPHGRMLQQIAPEDVERRRRMIRTMLGLLPGAPGQ